MKNNELTVRALMARRQQLNDELFRALCSFEEDTGIDIRAVNIPMVDVGSNEAPRHMVGLIDIELVLPTRGAHDE